MHSYIGGLLGGALIGAASGIFLLHRGRVLGVSGLIASFPSSGTMVLVGILLSSLLAKIFCPESMNYVIEDNYIKLGISGILVGIGAKLANGCTSGHGVCGLVRFSKRSIIAISLFMIFAFFTNMVVNIWLVL